MKYVQTEIEVPAECRGPSTYSLAILGGLSRKRFGEVYQGTVSWREKRRRRARNKRARLSRRANR